MSQESTLPIFIADAFTDEPFRGNPAAVCPVPFGKVIPNDRKQQIAAEMNLSETAFVSIINDKDTFQNGQRFALQWFTPTCEVSLCGHATMATAYVLFSAYKNQSRVLQFETISGVLTAKKLAEGKISIDLPAYQYKPVDKKKYERVIQAAIGSLPVQDVVLSESGKLLVRMRDDLTRRQLEEPKPRESELLEGTTDLKGLIATLKTSPGEAGHSDSDGRAYDFISRYFAPWLGVLEDPVTGSAHSVLTPYWTKALKKTELHARQCSPRGGDLDLKLEGDRVIISGHAVMVVQGHINF